MFGIVLCKCSGNVLIGYVILFQEYEETCPFTIARFSASESLRVYPNIYKNSPPFASSKSFPLVGFAMSVWERESASDSTIVFLLALREDVSILAHVFLYLFLLFILISHHILL